MRTEEAVKQIKPYLIGDLTPKETAILEGHLDVNEEARWWHARYYRQMLPVLKQPEAKPSEGVTEALFAKARVMIEEGKEVQRPALRVLASDLWAYRKVAAALIVAAGITFAVIGFGGGKPKSDTAGVVAVAATATTPARSFQFKSGDTVKAPENSNASVRLSDGTVLRLTGGTEATIRKPAPGEFFGATSTRWAVEVAQGDVMVDSTANAGIDDMLVSVRSPSGDFNALAAPGTLVAVSYRSPVKSVERRSDRVIDVDMRRQPMSEILDIAASHFGRKISYPPQANEWFVDVRGRGLDWKGFVDTLNASNILVEEVDGAWVWKDGGNGNIGRKQKREMFDVTVLEGLCTVSAEGVSRNPIQAGGNSGAIRVMGHSAADGELHMATPADAGRAEAGRYEREVIQTFLAGPTSGGAPVTPALVTVLDRATSGILVYSKGPTLSGTQLQVLDDHDKVIFVGGDATISGKTGRVIHIDRESQATYLQDATGAVHKVVKSE